ncbi:uncharacterized protein ACR2FA_000677 [Aphomia sociella]
MGCVCCSLSSFVSILLDALERISLCTVCAMLTCCLLFTIISVMVLGIGIGYHYCFVTNSVESMAKAAKAAGALRSGEEPVTMGNVMRSVEKAVKRGFAHRVARRDADKPVPFNNLNDTSFFYRNFSSFNITNVTSL